MTTPFRILVTGSRHCTDEQAAYVRAMLHATADRALSQNRPVVVVHGQCHRGGVDLVADQWTEMSTFLSAERVPADWSAHGKAAGMIRNAELVKRGADICLAFPAKGSRGTWDCVRKAADAGIPVQVWPLR